MNRKSMGSSLMLLLTAFIWGVAFVAQSVGVEYVRPFTFNAARFILGGLVLIPVIVFMRREKTDRFRESSETWEGIKGGILCGIALFVAASFQQFGVSMTTVGKAGFITALYIVIVPILGVFMRKKVPAFVWVSVALATVGMYLLCITEGFRIGTGDLCVFICAVCFSFHILIIDCVSPKADGVLISCIQFFTAGVLALIPAAFLEKPSAATVLAAWQPIAYAGIMSSGVGYTLQVVAQKNTDPTVASLLMSLESVFSLLAGWVILGQKLSRRELLGCVLVFAAVILAQLPGRAEE